MVESDGLTEEQVPMNMRCGSPSRVIDRLTGEAKPSLSDLRNDSAHGAPFDGFPQSGLLELVRDLIDYAYRDWPSVVEMAVIARLTRSRVRSRRISRNVRERHTQPAFAGSAAASGSARPSYGLWCKRWRSSQLGAWKSPWITQQAPHSKSRERFCV
jgi:hypothetical protein